MKYFLKIYNVSFEKKNLPVIHGSLVLMVVKSTKVMSATIYDTSKKRPTRKFF